MRQQQSDQSIDGHPIFAALYDWMGQYPEENIFPEHRRYLSRDLQGAVLDLGVGTGAMFPYLKQALQQETSLQLHGVEPDPHMRKRAIEKAEQNEVPIDIRPARAESLPYEDETFETVIAFTVFCTIDDVEQALNEVHRVLQPNGELRFYEHVHTDGLPGRVQNILTPVWKRAVAGCHLNRDTERALRESALDIVEITTTDLFFPTTPTIRGIAIRK